uniref:Uncharacterized protein n=1 Tax=Podoviridae sp. ctQyH19 TaxID=2825249 RepID=A0A8S5UQX7_9CAUD|nr:MAG TPA: hypothetical protein [Podoviridae sp. ctQyH19]
MIFFKIGKILCSPHVSHINHKILKVNLKMIKVQVNFI